MSPDPPTPRISDPTFDDILAASSVHAALLTFYDNHASETGLVPKTAVDPQELKSVLPSLLLLKKNGCSDWKFTIVGTGVVAGYGEDFSGAILSEFHHLPCRAVYSEMIDSCVASNVPYVCVGKMRYPGREFLDTMKTVIPVSECGYKVNHCLFGLSIENRPESLGRFYDPIKPLEALDRLYQVTVRDQKEEADAWPVEFKKEIHTQL